MSSFTPGSDRHVDAAANKLRIALQVREAMREHRKGKPISFSEADWRRVERKGRPYGTL